MSKIYSDMDYETPKKARIIELFGQLTDRLADYRDRILQASKEEVKKYSAEISKLDNDPTLTSFMEVAKADAVDEPKLTSLLPLLMPDCVAAQLAVQFMQLTGKLKVYNDGCRSLGEHTCVNAAPIPHNIPYEPSFFEIFPFGFGSHFAHTYVLFFIKHRRRQIQTIPSL